MNTDSTRQNAIYISDPVDLKYFYNSSFDRIYFGNECCEFLIPNHEQIQAMIVFASTRGVQLTFVTPPCSEKTLSTMAPLLMALPDGTEVVFNDWGLLGTIIRAHKTPVHGRLLCNIKKDPRLNALRSDAEYTRENNINRVYQNVLLSNGVFRVELDNVCQGMTLHPDNPLKCSLYYPYVLCSLTRKCFFPNKARGNIKFQTITQCPVHCHGLNMQLKTGGEFLYMQGNAQFYMNDVLSDEMFNMPGMDRYVYMPVIPNHNFTSKNNLYLDWNRLFETYRLNDLWGENPDAPMVELCHQILKQDSRRARNILDIGCGTGRHASQFKNCHYYGIDISSSAIEIARQSLNGTFIHGDILQFKDYENYFDLAIDYGCFHTIPPNKRRLYFESVYHAMKPDSLLLLCAWQCGDTRLPVFYIADQIPEWGLSINELLNLSSDYFEVINHQIIPCTHNKMIYAILKKQTQNTM